jgi:hypothetical protein
MKKIITIWLISMITLSAFAQNPFYDSKIIVEKKWAIYSNVTNTVNITVSKPNAGELLSILSTYLSETERQNITQEPDPVKKFNLYKSAFARNPFIQIAGTVADNPLTGLDLNKSTKSLLSRIGGLDITNFADGLAKFLVKRTKQELSVSFFDHFLDDLKSKPDLQKIFPDTYKVLLTIETEIYQYAAYMQALREAFNKDINNLPLNIGKIGTLSAEPSFIQGLNFIQIVSGGTHPAELLNSLSIPLNATNNAKDLANAAKLVKLFSNSLKSKNPNHYWISSDSLRLLANDDDAFKIYLGLIYQLNEQDPIIFSNGKGLKDILAWLSLNLSNIGQYKSFITTLIQKAEDLEGYISQLKNIPTRERTYNDYYQLYNSSLNLLEFILTVDSIPQFTAITGITVNNVSNQNFFIALRLVGNIYLEANQKKYGTLIIDVAQLLDILIPGGYTWRGQFIKYGSFAAAVAQAENSDDVEAAIESVALPSGSSRIKRESKFNISLNAFVGLYFGHEEEKFSLKHGKKINSYGITAPVGVSGSWGVKHSSLGFFVSVIDIGAITAFRFSNDSTKSLSKIELKDIISPGVFFSWGIPKTPISLNAGYQITPYLRSVSLTNNTFSSSYSRFSVSALIDIPLLNFYTKSK